MSQNQHVASPTEVIAFVDNNKTGKIEPTPCLIIQGGPADTHVHGEIIEIKLPSNISKIPQRSSRPSLSSRLKSPTGPKPSTSKASALASRRVPSLLKPPSSYARSPLSSLLTKPTTSAPSSSKAINARSGIPGKKFIATNTILDRYVDLAARKIKDKIANMTIKNNFSSSRTNQAPQKTSFPFSNIRLPSQPIRPRRSPYIPPSVPQKVNVKLPKARLPIQPRREVNQRQTLLNKRLPIQTSRSRRSRGSRAANAKTILKPHHLSIIPEEELSSADSLDLSESFETLERKMTSKNCQTSRKAPVAEIIETDRERNLKDCFINELCMRMSR